MRGDIDEVHHALPKISRPDSGSHALRGTDSGVGAGGRERLRESRTTGIAGLCATAVAGARLSVVARILGVGWLGLLLGAWQLGRTAGGWRVVDSGLLGFSGRRVCLEWRLL